ncbi:MAG: carboxypeptidase regulatory-like domain-containing protein [Candidatus Acidiferrales bacterium]
MRRIWQVLLLAFLGAAFFFLSGSVWGQATTSLRGAVTDPSGAAIPNATVHLINTDTNLERTTTTDQQGEYVFSEVVPGHNVLQVDAAGFSKFEQRGFELLVNLPSTINVRMKVGAATTTVEVTAQAPLLNTTDASQGNTMSGGEISNMPLYARNVTQLLSVQPGVVFTSNRTDLAPNDTRSGSVNGAHSDQNNLTLDGVDVNDQGTGSPFETVLPVTVASVEEFRVSTADYGADQGHSSGAQSALVTKGGTNTFHGSLYEFNRNDLGEANDFFNKSAEEASDEPNKPLQLVYNIFGGTIGGPVKHDRLFFFLNYEGHRQNQAISDTRTIPSPTLADGIIQYPCATPSQCLGGTVTGLSGKQYNVAPGNFALNASQLKAMDPLGIGPSPSSIAYFKSYLSNPAVAVNPNNDPSEGDGLGLNFDGFLFPATQRQRDDILIGRVDYKLNASGTQTLFWRGSGQDDYIPGGPTGTGAPLLPGGQFQTTYSDFSKGMVAGYTAVIRPNLVNNFRYGLTRQSIMTSGDSTLPYNQIRLLSQDEGNYDNGFSFPVHNFTDDLSWTKGNHTFTFGTDIDLIYNNSATTTSSFSDGSTNAAWLNVGGFAGKASPFNPSFNCPGANCYPAVDPGFDTYYDFPLIGLLGMVTEVDAQYNVAVNSDGSGNALAQGAPVQRHFEMRENEFYAQDSWKIKPNLTFNYGLRYEQITPPWETDGQEVAPTQDLGTWFEERAQGMARGTPANQFPPVSFDLAGRANGRPDWWATGEDFAPHFSIAWSPEPSADWLRRLVGTGDKTVIRAGFGKYYDHFGQSMIETFNTSGGEFGLSTLLTNPAQVESAASSPRWQPLPGQGLASAVNNIPTTDNSGVQIFTPAPAVGFPTTFPAGNFCICWGIDSSLKTPYSYALDFSISRELPHNMAIEVAYVGRLGHNLLVQSDLAQPLNLTDPASGITYYQAAQAMANLARINNNGGTNPANVTSATIGPTGAYWRNLFSPVTPGDEYNVAGTVGASSCGNWPLTPTTDPVTAIYQTYLCNADNETSALDFFDVAGIASENGGPSYFAKTGPYTWFDDQYSSLFAWRSQGWSHYESMQVTFKKQMTNGLQFNVNYTYSTSFDLASDAESVGEWSALSGNVVNPWMGNQLSGPSDFDLRHQINAQWVWQLPFGQGRQLASHINRPLDAVIGGWQLSGLMRWSSGFPVSAGTCFCFPTNWQLTGVATSTSQISGGHYDVADQGGTVGYNIFSDPATVFNDISVPLPGESGSRNPFRGDGFYDWDMELGKIWKMPYNENHTLHLTADMFNVFNINRFDVQSLTLSIDNPATFGDYQRLLTLPRTMQFGLQYEF